MKLLITVLLKNNVGVVISSCNLNTIRNNNFIDNDKGLNFVYPITPTVNIIMENYWDKPRSLPKIIFGFKAFILPFPWILIDWHPAKEPYDIPRL